MIAVIIPAHDEAAMLPACLRAVHRAALDLRLGNEPVRVYVALDDCTDASAEIVAAQHAIGVPCHGCNVGAARAHAAACALGDGARWLASTDADSLVPPNWLSAQLAHAADVVCGIVCVIDWRERGSRARALYERHYHARDGHRHVHGANLGVAAASYQRAGGFHASRSHEDVSLVARLQEQRARVAWAANPCVATSARHSPRCAEGYSAHLDGLERSVGGVA